MIEVSDTAFSARCLALLDEVSETGCELVVTRQGEPIARVVPAAGEPSLLGSVKYLVSDEELIRSPAVDWEAGREGPADPA